MHNIKTFMAGATSVALVWVLVAGALPLVSAERPAPNPTGMPNIAQVVRNVGPAVVAIQVEQRVPTSNVGSRDPMADLLRRFGRSRPQQKRSGQGSGVIVDRAGHVLTNAHVVRNASKITVRLHDGRAVPATLIGADAQSDIAVLKIPAQDITPALIGSSEALQVGEWVVAIGTPFGLQQTVTAGIVSAKGRSTVGIVDHEDFIQTDAAINPGNSGGPLLNLRGEIVGINSAIFSRSGGSMGIGFAIPAKIARHVMSKLTQDGQVHRGYLGVVVQDITTALAKAMQLPSRDGAMIAQIQAGSAAEKAGLRVGDVVLRVGTTEIRGSASLRNAVALLDPGVPVETQLLRDGKTLILRPELSTRPAPGGAETWRAPAERMAAPSPALGLGLTALTDRLATQLRVPQEGVLIRSVARGSAAQAAGLKPGAVLLSIDRQTYDDADQAAAALAQQEPGSKVVLRVRQEGASHFLVLSVPQ